MAYGRLASSYDSGHPQLYTSLCWDQLSSSLVFSFPAHQPLQGSGVPFATPMYWDCTRPPRCSRRVLSCYSSMRAQPSPVPRSASVYAGWEVLREGVSPDSAGYVHSSVDIRYQDGRMRASSDRESGFLLPSEQCSEDLLSRPPNEVSPRDTPDADLPQVSRRERPQGESRNTV